MDIKKLLWALSLAFSLDVSAKVGDRDPKAVNKHLTIAASYLNTFDTFGSLVDQLGKSGILFRAEKRTLLEILKARGVAPEAKLPKFKVVNNQLLSGRYGWSYFDKDSYKLQQGRIVRFGKSPPVEIFEKSVAALEEKVHASSWGFWANEANALSLEDVYDTTASALSLTAVHVMRLGVGDILAPVSGAVAGTFGSVMENRIWPLRNWIKAGKVHCDDFGNYILDQGINGSAWPTDDDTMKLRGYCKKDQKRHDVVGWIAGHSELMCTYVSKMIDYANNAFSRQPDKVLVSNSTLHEVLGVDLACTEKKAEKVGLHLKAKLESQTAEEPASSTGGDHSLPGIVN